MISSTSSAKASKELFMKLPTDTRPKVWGKPHGWGMFTPNGKRHVYGMRPNPKTWSGGEDTWSARLFVGFNVGERTVYEMKDLVKLVRKVREEQTGDPSSTFISQRGIYKHSDSGIVVEEPGAQIIIIAMGVTPEAFEAQMTDLAEIIAAKMDQEEVVVELQRRGIVESVFGVSAAA